MGNKVLEILSNTRKGVESELKTNLGTKKESIYKEELFEGLSDKEKKSSRKKIRNLIHSIFESVIEANKENNKKSLSKLAKSFADFYRETYKINDYSFASVASENTKDKEIIKTALDIIKKELKIK